MTSGSRARRSGERSLAWGSAGSGPGINWPCVPRPGGRPKGAETRAGGPRPHRRADARRDDHHRDAAAVLLLRPHRPAGARADHRPPGQADPPWGDQRRHRDVAGMITTAWTRDEHQDFLSVIRSHWRGWNLVLFEDRASQHTAPESLAWAES